jgi:GGDEF domain-containing protein
MRVLMAEDGAVRRRGRSITRTDDALGRFGGEEFLIVAPDICRLAETLGQDERLRECLAWEPIETFEGQVLLLSASGLRSGGK